MYIFKKTKKKVNNKNFLRKKRINLTNLKKEFFLFQKKCRDKISYLKKQHNEIVAFGAAQMMPILAYHSKTNFSFIDALFDDNPNRIGRYLPKIDLKIKKTNSKKIKNSFVLITANEMCRPIIKRLEKINPLRIITWYEDF